MPVVNMKAIKKLIPRTIKNQQSDISQNQFANLAGSAAEGSGKLTTERPKGGNHYTPWPTKDDEVVTPQMSTGTLPFSRPKKPKVTPSLSAYEEMLGILLIAKLDQNLENFDNFKRKSDANYENYEKLKKIRDKLNFKQYDKDFLEWKAYVQIFLTRIDHRVKVLQFITPVFTKVVSHIQENFLLRVVVETFWKSVEHVTDAVWSECVSEGIKILVTPSAARSSADPLVDSGFKFLGEIWNYFEAKGPAPLLDDELDAIARVHMESLMTKLKIGLVNSAKSTFTENVPELTLQGLCAAVPRFCDELKKNKIYWEHVFRTYKINLNLYEIIYSVWDLEIAEAVKPILQNAQSTLVGVKFEGKYPILTQNFDSDRDIALFTLFKVLRKFANLTDKTALPIFVHVKAFLFSWFRDFVPQWIDIACYRAMTWIDKAVKQDTLEPIISGCKRSNSSHQTVDFFSQMETSWHDLDWPNPVEAYNFAVLTLKNFDRCIEFYTEQICNRLEELDSETFHFGPSDEVFVAINNVEYVSQKVGSIADSLGIAHVLRKLSQYVQENERLTPIAERRVNHTAIDQCIETPPNIIQNWRENVHRRVSTCLIQSYDKQIEPLVDMFLETTTDNADTLRDGDRIIIHLIQILERMTNKLNSTEYARTFPTIADRILDSFLDYAQKNIQKTQHFASFQQMDDTLLQICALFRKVGIGDLVSNRSDEISSIQESLRLHKLSTDKLILEYIKNRHEDQLQSDRHDQEGFLTVITNYNEQSEVINLEILNGSLLKMGNVNSFVRFKIYTNSSTINQQGHNSDVHYNTKYPLYQKTFNINVPKSDFNSGGFIHFWVKTGHTCRWKFICEAFLPLDKISTQGSEYVQEKLPLTLPTDRNGSVLDILENRKDKEGIKFATTQRCRISLNK